MNANVTVLKDETFGGIEREYTEVKRKARVGERIKIVNAGMTFGKYGNGDIKTVLKAYVDGDAHFTVTPNEDGSNGELFANLKEYVVLEPTDIVRINSERLRMIERKAAVGERITPIIKRPYVTIGKTYTVTTISPSEEYPVYAHFIDDEGDRWHLPHSEYRVLDPVSCAQPASDPSTPSIAELAAITDGLTETVAKLTLKLAKLETRVRVTEEGVVLIETGVADEKAAKPVKELTRDDVIERAKADVQSYVDQNVRFRINCERRTVVCDVIIGGKRKYRGIAKAAPGDCFNAHIGRAIALRRALGLEVPAEYTNAQQPSEARVGDVVEYEGYRVALGPDGKAYNYTNGSVAVSSYVAKHGRIIDDSREEVAE